MNRKTLSLILGLILIGVTALWIVGKQIVITSTIWIFIGAVVFVTLLVAGFIWFGQQKPQINTAENDPMRLARLYLKDVCRLELGCEISLIDFIGHKRVFAGKNGKYIPHFLFRFRLGKGAPEGEAQQPFVGIISKDGLKLNTSYLTPIVENSEVNDLWKEFHPQFAGTPSEGVDFESDPNYSGYRHADSSPNQVINVGNQEKDGYSDPIVKNKED